MTLGVEQKTVNAVAILTFQGDNANALVPQMRRELIAAITRCDADDAVRGVVLRGSGGRFSQGIGLGEYDAAPISPTLTGLCDAVENLSKPVVAVLEGIVAGGGMSLALAAHGRVAAKSARIAFPEIRIGLIPGGGATQRLPRLTGAQAALRLMLGGQAISASDPMVQRVVNQVSNEDLEAAALALIDRMKTPRKTRDIRVGLSDPAAYLVSVEDIARQIGDPNGASAGIVKSIEAALLLPFDSGVAFEASIQEDCRGSMTARASRHVYKCNARLASMPGIETAPPGPKRDLKLTGEGGQLAAELTIMGLDAGWCVGLDVPDSDKIRTHIQRIYDQAVERGRLSAGLRDDRMRRLDLSSDDALPVILHLGASPPPGPDAGIVLAVGRKGQGGETPMPGIWFDRPAHSRKMAELSVATGTESHAAVACARALAGAAGKHLMRTHAPAGMAVRALRTGIFAVACEMMALGAAPTQIDAAAVASGFSEGPCAMMDRIGLARISADIARLSGPTGFQSPLSVLEAMIKAGRPGGAGSPGFYDPENPDQGAPSVVVALLRDIADHGPLATSKRLVSRVFSAAVVNLCVRCLERRIFLRASDVDVAFVAALGYGASRGGPLFQADDSGLLTMVKSLNGLSTTPGSVLEPDEKIRDMIGQGENFFGRPAVFGGAKILT